jgi:hypothetical protein
VIFGLADDLLMLRLVEVDGDGFEDALSHTNYLTLKRTTILDQCTVVCKAKLAGKLETHECYDLGARATYAV